MAQQISCPSCATPLVVEPPVLVALCPCGRIVTAQPFEQAANPRPPAASDVDYYTMLGVQRDASAADIKAAHRSRVRETHPDKGGDREEFLLVQTAYETLSNPDRRNAYDNQSETADNESIWIVPDVLTIRVDEAANQLNDAGFTFKVVAVEVPSQSSLAGLVVGQYPYPGWEVDAPVVGIVVAVSQTSSIWERIGRVAAEFSSGFNSTFWSQLTLTAPAQKAIGQGNPSARSAGERTGEIVGDVLVSGAQVAIAYVGTICFLFGLIIVVAALALVPAVGLVLGAIWAWLFWKFWKSLRRRRDQIISYRQSR